MLILPLGIFAVHEGFRHLSFPNPIFEHIFYTAFGKLYPKGLNRAKYDY